VTELRREDEPDLWIEVACRRQGVLATLMGDGRPQLSNVLYVANPDERSLRISTVWKAMKRRNLSRDPRCALHVQLGDFWAWAVVDGTAQVTGPADVDTGVTDHLMDLYRAIYPVIEDPEALRHELVQDRRVIVQIDAGRVYGMTSTSGRRPPDEAQVLRVSVSHDR
jgi:PPOX class probable F420-dependent enzyme